MLSYFIGAAFSGYFSIWVDAVSYFWLPSGVYLSALLITERRHWWVVVLATWLGDLMFNRLLIPEASWPLRFILFAHFGNTASALLGAWLVERFIGKRPLLNSPLQLVLLIVLGGVVALPLTATIGASLIDGWNPEISISSNWTTWYCSDLLGIILVTPAVLVWSQVKWDQRPPRSIGRTIEATALNIGLIFFTAFSYLYEFPKHTETLYVAFPFLIWAAIRFGRRGTTASILLAAIIAHWFTAFGLGSIGGSDLSPAQKSVEMLTSIGVFALVGLVPAVALAAQRQAEARTRASEERFQLAVNGSSAGIWDWDVRTNACYYSPRFKALLGFPTDDETAFPPVFESFFNRMHPDDKARFERLLAEHFSDPESPWDIDYQLLTHEEEYRWFNARGEAQRDEDGAVYRMNGSIIDITERKSLEMRMQHSEKLSVVGQLAGGIAHDFNNILAAVTMNIELLRLDHPKGETAASLSEVHRLTKRAARLTEQLLMFARRRHMELALTSASAALDEIAQLLRRLLPETIDLRVTPHGAPLWIKADTSMIDQVMLNLCINARDAMPAGGEISLSLTEVQLHDHQPLTVSTATARNPSGPHACFTVRDNGSGMDSALLQRIFEPFFTTKEPGKGTGLGLASAEGIMHQHRGWIEVESEVGVGTTFRVYLPAVPPPHHTPEATAASSFKYPHSSETILFIEDDEAVRTSTTAMLQNLGYRVITGTNAEHAMTLWRERSSPIHLLFTDTVMPGGSNGLELAQHLRHRDPALRVVLTSGYSTETISRAELARKGFLFLPKPFDRDTLAKILRQALETPLGS